MNKARTRILVINLILVVVVAGIGWWGWSALHPAAPAVSATSTTVSLGDVTSSVTASGKVISPGDVGVSPSTSGQITAINVKVGSHVGAGTVMATLENSTQLNALNQAKSSLATAQINFTQSATALQTAKDAVTSNAATYQTAIDAAKKSLADATTAADLKKSTYQFSVDTAKSTMDAAKKVYDSYSSFYGPSGFTLTYCADLININSNCTTLYNDYNSWQSALKSYNNALTNQTLSLNSDAQNIASLTSAITTAETAKTTGTKKDAAAVVSAQASFDLIKAQLGVGSDTPAPADFSVAQAALALAQRNYDATFVKAPVTGDVASISAVVGANAPTASSSTAGSVSGFIVLTNVSALRIQAGFSEADAAKLAVGQEASFTFSALTNVQGAGKVSVIDLLPTTANGTTTYTVTFDIAGSIPGLKPGMTATASVTTGAALNVLQASSQAFTVRGTSATVNVVTTKGGKEITTPTPVVIGLQGDSSIQIVSGVKAGAKLAIRTAASSTNSNGFPNAGLPSTVGGAGLGNPGGGGGRGGFGN